MTDEDAKLIYRSHEQVLVGGHLNLIDEIYADDFENKSPGLPDHLRRGHNSMRAQYTFLRSAFTEMELVSDQETIEGDLIGLHWIWKAKHTGEFLGIPPTGVQVQIEGFDIIQIYGGRIHAAWIIQDNASLMAQLQAAAAKMA